MLTDPFISQRPKSLAFPELSWEKLNAFCWTSSAIFPNWYRQSLLTRLQEISWRDISNTDIGRELGSCDEQLTDVLNWYFNNERLFSEVEKKFSCGSIGCFTGRLIKMLPGYDLHWHSDFHEHAVVGMSVNLSPFPFCGGRFQIKSSSWCSETMKPLAPGQAHFFSLGPDLLHRLTPVSGSIPRYTFAGWFRREPYFRSPEYIPLLDECLKD